MNLSDYSPEGLDALWEFVDSFSTTDESNEILYSILENDLYERSFM